MAQPIITGCQLVVEGIEYYWGDLHEQGDQFIFYCIQKTPLTRGYDSNTVKEVTMGPYADRFERSGVWIFPREQVTLNKAAMEHITPSQPVAAEATAEVVKSDTCRIDWAIQWICNNYQDHTNIASLLEAMRIAAYAVPVEVQGDSAEKEQAKAWRRVVEALNAAHPLGWQRTGFSAADIACEILAGRPAPTAPLSEVKRQRLKRGSTGVCSRAVCICEQDGLGDECVWLSPLTPRSTPSNKRGEG